MTNVELSLCATNETGTRRLMRAAIKRDDDGTSGLNAAMRTLRILRLLKA